MRTLKTFLAIAFVATSGLVATSVGPMGAAQAKAHVTPGKPGRCGVLKYYSKKDKGCVSKG